VEEIAGVLDCTYLQLVSNQNDAYDPLRTETLSNSREGSIIACREYRRVYGAKRNERKRKTDMQFYVVMQVIDTYREKSMTKDNATEVPYRMPINCMVSQHNQTELATSLRGIVALQEHLCNFLVLLGKADRFASLWQRVVPLCRRFALGPTVSNLVKPPLEPLLGVAGPIAHVVLTCLPSCLLRPPREMRHLPSIPWRYQ
jgi:hypothetical protein